MFIFETIRWLIPFGYFKLNIKFTPFLDEKIHQNLNIAQFSL